MSRRTLLVLAGLVVFVLGLVVTFPARVAIDLFAPPAVRAWGVEGSVWDGRAAALELNGAGVGGVEWEISALALLGLRLSADVRIRRLDGFANASVSVALFGDSIRFTDLEAAIKLETLPRQLVPQGTRGEVSARFPVIELTEGWPSRLVGRAGAAELDLPGVKYAIGPLEFVFPEDRDPPVADVRSLGGPLSVEGTLALPGQQRWVLDALLGPGENAPRGLVEGLAYVGEATPDGRRHVRYPLDE